MEMEHTQSMPRIIKSSPPASRSDQAGRAANTVASDGDDSPQSGLSILRNIVLYLMLLPAGIVLLIRLFLD